MIKMQGRTDRNCVSAHVLLQSRASLWTKQGNTLERRQRVFSYTIRSCKVTTIFKGQQLPITMERNIGMG